MNKVIIASVFLVLVLGTAFVFAVTEKTTTTDSASTQSSVVKPAAACNYFCSNCATKTCDALRRCC